LHISSKRNDALNPTQKIIHLIEDVIQAHNPKTTKKEIRELAEGRFEELGLPAEVYKKSCRIIGV